MWQIPENRIYLSKSNEEGLNLQCMDFIPQLQHDVQGPRKINALVDCKIYFKMFIIFARILKYLVLVMNVGTLVLLWMIMA